MSNILKDKNTPKSKMFITIQIENSAYITNITMFLFHVVPMKIDAFVSSVLERINPILKECVSKSVVLLSITFRLKEVISQLLVDDLMNHHFREIKFHILRNLCRLWSWVKALINAILFTTKITLFYNMKNMRLKSSKATFSYLKRILLMDVLKHF